LDPQTTLKHYLEDWPRAIILAAAFARYAGKTRKSMSDEPAEGFLRTKTNQQSLAFHWIAIALN
jgi:hypothetical protein